MRLRTLLFFTLILLTLAGCSGSSSEPAAQGQAPVAPANLAAQTTTGQDEAVTLTWDAVADAVSYNIYWASASGVNKASATAALAVTTPYIATGLPGGTPCWFTVTAVSSAGESALSAEVSATPRAAVILTGKLNDTGIDFFADATSNGLTSAPAGFEGQDASHGRDAAALANTLTKTGGGVAGFDFTKLGSDGNPLADQNAVYAATPWNCVRDNATGLIWEVKTDDGALRDKDNTYSWYNTDPATNGGAAGTANGGSCTGGIDCDTTAYVAAVNAAGLCGYSDWRLPQVEELRSIVDYGVASPGPTIDTDYFPNTRSTWFWSASPYAGNSDGAWGVGFYRGLASVYYKSNDFDVRLVRGGQ